MADAEKGDTDGLTEAKAPPKYGTVSATFKVARKSRNQGECCTQVCKVIGNSAWPTFMVAVSTGLPIAMMVMGSLYINECPRQRFIPIYLIVFGAFALVKALSTLVQRLASHYKHDEDIPCEDYPIDGMLGCFLMVWFIAGNVWVYGAYRDYSTDPASADYCSPTLYDFAFWMVTLVYILGWISLITCCVVRICLASVFDLIWDLIC